MTCPLKLYIYENCSTDMSWTVSLSEQILLFSHMKRITTKQSFKSTVIVAFFKIKGMNHDTWKSCQKEMSACLDEEERRLGLQMKARLIVNRISFHGSSFSARPADRHGFILLNVLLNFCLFESQEIFSKQKCCCVQNEKCKSCLQSLLQHRETSLH